MLKISTKIEVNDVEIGKHYFLQDDTQYFTLIRGLLRNNAIGDIYILVLRYLVHEEKIRNPFVLYDILKRYITVISYRVCKNYINEIPELDYLYENMSSELLLNTNIDFKCDTDIEKYLNILYNFNPNIREQFERLNELSESIIESNLFRISGLIISNEYVNMVNLHRNFHDFIVRNFDPLFYYSKDNTLKVEKLICEIVNEESYNNYSFEYLGDLEEIRKYIPNKNKNSNQAIVDSIYVLAEITRYMVENECDGDELILKSNYVKAITANKDASLSKFILENNKLSYSVKDTYKDDLEVIYNKIKYRVTKFGLIPLK